ncbi:MAG: Adenylyl-sulfate kinase [Pseudidiomarina mangrovi]|nr:MAG: Adenylyl-sulfate kinase [Pseudidiomarina mangrovi]
MTASIVWHNHQVSAEQRAQQKQQQPLVIWFTGLSGAGKSTLANAVDQLLLQRQHHSYVIDGDNLRHGLNRDLSFSVADRSENCRRIGELCQLFIDAGLIVLVAAVSPLRADRDAVRQRLPQGRFVEVFVDASLAVCEQRDSKGLYQRARRGDISDFTGISSPYEPPLAPELQLNTMTLSSEQAAQQVIDYLRQQQFIR